MTTSQLSPRAAVILGLLSAVCGAIPIFGALGIVPLNLSDGTPIWVGVCAGLMFVLLGAALIVGYAVAGGTGPDGNLPPGTSFAVRLVQYLLGLGITGLMTVIASWIAFGAGHRQFSSTLNLPFMFRQWSGGELSGRILFGLGALLLGAMFVGLALVGAGRLRRR